MKKNQNNRIEIIFSRLSELYKIDWIYLERVFFLQLILALICCVCFGFRVFFFFLFVFVFWFFGCLPNTGNGDDWWAHAACFALPRWLTVHDNAPRATNALATLPAMWNLRTQRRPRNTLPRQQQNSSAQAQARLDVRRSLDGCGCGCTEAATLPRDVASRGVIKCRLTEGWRTSRMWLEYCQMLSSPKK